MDIDLPEQSIEILIYQQMLTGSFEIIRQGQLDYDSTLYEQSDKIAQLAIKIYQQIMRSRPQSII